MSIDRSKNARLGLRVNDVWLSRFKAWVNANPDFKDNSEAAIEAIDILMGSGDPDCGFLSENERQIVDNYRRDLNPIPSRRQILTGLIESLQNID